MIEIKKKYFRGGGLHKIIWLEEDEIHRIGSPAYIVFHMNGTIHTYAWYHYGTPHRISGPAVVYYNEKGDLVNYEWFINGNIIDQPYNTWPLTTEQQIELKLSYG